MEKIIHLAKTWTDGFGLKSLNENKATEPMLIWAYAFSNLLQLTAKEESLVQATVVYKRPSTLATMLANYKKVAHSTTKILVQEDLNLARNVPLRPFQPL